MDMDIRAAAKKLILMDFIILGKYSLELKRKEGSTLKILLVQSPTGRPEAPIYPIGLAFIAGQLSHHELNGLDLSLNNEYRSMLRESIESFSPEIIALSLRNIDDSSYPVTYSYVKSFSEIMDVLESWKGIVIAGGTGFSIYPEIILERFPRIDYGIPGEGEKMFPELIDHLEKGIAIEGWSGGRMLPWKQTDLSSLSPPDYRFIDISRYNVPDSIGVQSRRGCAFSCSYCTYGYLSGSTFRCRSVDKVVRDIKELEYLGVSRFAFIDSVFNAPEDYFEELLSALEESDFGISWSAWLDQNVTRSQLVRMKAAGAVKVDFSPDAITDRGLKELAKRGKAADLLPAVTFARRAGLQVGINFFNGNPGEGFLAFLRKLWFMLRVRSTLGWKSTFVNIGTIRVYAHSPLAGYMRRKGIAPEDCTFFEPVFYRSRGPGDWLYRLFQRVRRLKHG
ncbi:MAG: radical SAM protein [Candidatus Aegiribacteria sp.]|nr:radical SAM protein [Candidatus Aegiribacteria sp.]